ncbi:hypothetical protein SAMD00019534_083890, partial [Acytostelium subglobosum LB1]|uniref:hypothetical protein n=1 Tax=Acytostelium subglobosum LB1 TaxID=1410327 RepID=UPI000644CBF3
SLSLPNHSINQLRNFYYVKPNKYKVRPIWYWRRYSCNTWRIFPCSSCSGSSRFHIGGHCSRLHRSRYHVNSWYYSGCSYSSECWCHWHYRPLLRRARWRCGWCRCRCCTSSH